MKSYKKIEFWFLLTGLFLFLIGFVLEFTFKTKTFDIQVHDTYFVIPYFYYLTTQAIILIIIGVSYYLFQKTTKIKLNYTLGLSHLMFTIISFIGFSFLPYFIANFNKPQRYYANSDSSFLNKIENINMVINLFLILFNISILLVEIP